MSDAPTLPPHDRAGEPPRVGNLDDTAPPGRGPGAPVASLPTGTRLDRYEILGELGRGAMGVVYRAADSRTGREVALKVLGADAGADRESVARFAIEARAAARLAAHPGIAAVHDTGGDGTRTWYAMALVPGLSLDDALATTEPSWQVIARLLQLAAEALAHAHRHGVLHRDLKPGNILVGTDALARDGQRPGPGDVCLTDFGLAALLETPHGARLTLPGTTLGTPAYMAPEQARGGAVDARTDVYGLGATLFHACTGRAPVTGDSSPAILAEAAAGAVADARVIAPGIPAGLAAILRRALATDPAARYPDATALADDLGRFAAGQPVHAAAFTARAAGWLSRQRRRLALVAAGLLLAGGTVWSVPHLRARTARAAHGAAQSASAGDVAERAATAAAAWRRLVGPTLGAIRTLEDAWHGVPVAPDARAAARRQVEAVAAGPAPLAEAWRAFAAALDGADGAADRLAALAAASEDPHIWMLAGRLALAAFARAAELPGYAVGPDAAPAALESASEPPAAAAARRTAQSAIAHARTSPLWTALPDAAALQRFAEGAAALAEARDGEAEAALAPLADDPMLGTEAGLLRGIALSRAGRFPEAAAAFEGVLPRGWPTVRLDAARAWMCAAAGVLPAARPAVLDRALGHLDHYLAAAPTDVSARSTRGIVHWLRADAVARTGGNPTAALEAAIADHDGVVAAVPDAGAARLNRANAWRRLAEYRAGASGDAAAAWVQGIADLEAALATTPGSRALTRSLATNLVGLAAARCQAGADPEPALARAFAAFDRGEAGGPPDAEWYVELGIAHGWRGEFAWRTGQDPTASHAAARAGFEAALALVPGHRRALAERGRSANATGNWCMTTGGDAAPWFRRAVADLDVVVAATPDDLESRVCRGGARVNLATIAAAAGEDPAALVAAALEDLTAAVRARDGDATAWLFQAHAHRVQAEWQAAHGTSAAGGYASAVAAYESALARRPDLAEPLAPLLAACRAAAR